MHVLIDVSPHVLEDEVGLQLVNPDEDWRSRPDMDPVFTRSFRSAIVARARFVEDLVVEQAELGVRQYVILGAGLDTFVQRRSEISSRLQIFEVDEPGPQAWKRRRLVELGFGIPDYLRFVPVDFELETWWEGRLAAAGFESDQPAVVASTGVSMYLTREANTATLEQIASFASGSTLAMTFLLPPALLAEEDRRGLEMAERGAADRVPVHRLVRTRRSGRTRGKAGFRDVRHVPLSDLAQRYFVNRTDGLRPSTGEDFLIATT